MAPSEYLTFPQFFTGCEKYTFLSDDYWRCSIRTLSYTLHHQVATCRMGPATDPTTVVNYELKVHGM